MVSIIVVFSVRLIPLMYNIKTKISHNHVLHLWMISSCLPSKIYLNEVTRGKFVVREKRKLMYTDVEHKKTIYGIYVKMKEQ